MNENLNQTKRTARVYGLGGGGTNIAYKFERMRGGPDAGFTELDVTYADTSRSNMRSDIPAKSVYLVDGVDGSGSVRSENHHEIHGRIKDILQQFKPADLNIVISTAAGGTGSVISPLLVKELIDRNAPTIVILVGDTSTRQNTSNTLKTIKSFEAIAQKTDVPVVMHYLQNSKMMTRELIDKQVVLLVTLLSALFSGQNRELDSRDLYNFLRFNNKVTTFGAQLVTLQLVSHTDPADDLGNVISVATLAADGQDTNFVVMPEYQCVGYLAPSMDQAILKDTPSHFVTCDGLVPEIVKELERILSQLDETQSARLQRRSFITNNDQVDDTGLVL